MNVQEEFTSTENRIGFARRHYNDTVLQFNNMIQMFPNSVVAGHFSFEKRDCFELKDEEQREPVKVQI